MINLYSYWMSHSKFWDSRFVFWRFRTRNSARRPAVFTEVSLNFPVSPQTNGGIRYWNRCWPLPTVSLTIETRRSCITALPLHMLNKERQNKTYSRVQCFSRQRANRVCYSGKTHKNKTYSEALLHLPAWPCGCQLQGRFYWNYRFSAFSFEFCSGNQYSEWWTTRELGFDYRQGKRFSSLLPWSE